MRNLSPSDRALIDAAIAEGRVQRVETGVWTMPVQVQGGKHVAYRLIRPGVPIEEAPILCRYTHRELEPAERKKRERRVAANSRKGARQRAEKRWSQYRDMIRRKLTVEQMADEAGVTVTRARQVLREMGHATAEGGAPCERDALAAMVEEGLTAVEIARRVGVTDDTIYGRLRRYGLKLKGAPDPGRKTRDELRPEYERLIAAGATVAEIAKAVERGPTTVRDHLEALGLRTVRSRT